MPSVNVSKKYSILQQPIIKNQDIVLSSNGNYYPSDEYTGFGLVRVAVPEASFEEITINPSTSTQVFTPTTNGYSKVTLNAVDSSIDPNIVSTNILKGISILGVEGTADIRTEDITITPSTSVQTFTPEYGGFYNITVNAVTSIIDSNLVPENIRKNVVILDVVGSYEEALQDKTIVIDSSIPTTTVITPDSGYSGLSSLTIDMTWIENNLLDLNAGDSVTEINLQNKTFSAAGSYTCDDGYDGLGTVTINLDWVDAAIESASMGTPDGTADMMISNTTHHISTDADVIRDYAFYYQTNLERLILTSATTIGNYAFANSGLKTLTIATSSICTLTNVNAFNGTLISNIYVPNNLVNSYKTANNWNTYASIISAIS